MSLQIFGPWFDPPRSQIRTPPPHRLAPMQVQDRSRSGYLRRGGFSRLAGLTRHKEIKPVNYFTQDVWTMVRDRLSGVSLVRATLSGMLMVRDTMSGVSMVRDTLSGVSMVRDSLSGVSLVGDSLSGLMVMGTLSGVSSVRDTLSGVSLVRDSLSGVSLVGDSLSGLMVRDTLSGVSLVREGHAIRVHCWSGTHCQGCHWSWTHRYGRQWIKGSCQLIRDILSGVPMIRGSHAFMNVSRQEDAVGSFSGQRHSVSCEPMDQGLLLMVYQ